MFLKQTKQTCISSTKVDFSTCSCAWIFCHPGQWSAERALNLRDAQPTQWALWKNLESRTKTLDISRAVMHPLHWEQTPHSGFTDEKALQTFVIVVRIECFSCKYQHWFGSLRTLASLQQQRQTDTLSQRKYISTELWSLFTQLNKVCWSKCVSTASLAENSNTSVCYAGLEVWWYFNFILTEYRW